MKAISIKQPWAYLICSGIKDVENRNWKCPQKYIGQRILIHASAKPTVKGNCISCWMTEDQYKFITLNISSGKRLNDICFLEHYSSAIIGSVKIVDCVVNHPSVWAEKGVFNWVLSEPILYENPIVNVKGKLSFWEYDGIEEVTIECPECGFIQPAVVNCNTAPFNTYIHDCKHCGYLIQESEWNEVKEEDE
jgi:hypothetical protein